MGFYLHMVMYLCGVFVSNYLLSFKKKNLKPLYFSLIKKVILYLYLKFIFPTETEFEWQHMIIRHFFIIRPT